MVGFVGKFLLSLLLTNWIISEIALFHPPFVDFTERVTKTLALPTHDQWPELVDPVAARNLSFELAGLFDSSTSVHQWITRAAPRPETPEIRVSAVPADFIPVARLELFRFSIGGKESGEYLGLNTVSES